MDTKKTVEVGPELMRPAAEPKIVFSDKAKVFFRVEDPINLLFSLRAWKLD